jgi:TM2 domain-containing membrane protein YozV
MTYPMQTVSNDRLAQQMAAQSAYDDAKKSAGVAYAFWFFLGCFGGHRFYLGHVGVGLGMLFTFGGFGLWALIDVFFIGSRLRAANAATKAQIFAQHGLPMYG